MLNHRFLLLPLTLGCLLSFAPDRAEALKPPVKVKCAPEKIKKAYKASHGEFKIASGLAVETRSGNVKRTPLKVQKGCLLEAKAGDVVLLEFSEKAKKKLRMSTRFEMQCVDAKQPNGKFLGYDAAPQASVADGKAWTPPCSAQGLSKAEKRACSKGISNSDRKTHWRNALKKKKKFAMDFYIHEDAMRYTRSSEPYVGSDRKSVKASEVAPSGKLFCQWFNKEDKNVLFAVMFDIPEG